MDIAIEMVPELWFDPCYLSIISLLHEIGQFLVGSLGDHLRGWGHLFGGWGDDLRDGSTNLVGDVSSFTLLFFFLK